jgi:excisionase family DNA binding protein
LSIFYSTLIINKLKKLIFSCKFETLYYICSMTIQTEVLMTIKNYASKLNVTTSYIYKLIKEKKMQPVEIDGVKFIDTLQFPHIPKK